MTRREQATARRKMQFKLQSGTAVVPEFVSNKQRASAVRRLMERNLPIDENGCISAGYAQDNLDDHQLWHDINLALAPSKLEYMTRDRYHKVDKLIETIRIMAPLTYENHIQYLRDSELAIHYLKKKLPGQLKSMQKELDSKLTEIVSQLTGGTHVQSRTEPATTATTTATGA